MPTSIGWRASGPGLPGQRQEPLRDAWHALLSLAEQRDRRRVPLFQRLIDRGDVAPSLLAFRRRLVYSPVLGSLPGNGRLGIPPQAVVPALKELALFYEDFLTVTDKDGNYIFVPSFSPENNPGNLTPSMMLVINASMDIAVCREVLSNLVQACELLGNDAGSVAKWKAMLAKLPPTCWKRTAPRRNGLGPHWKSVTPIGISLISTGPGQATRSIRTARRNWPGPR